MRTSRSLQRAIFVVVLGGTVLLTAPGAKAIPLFGRRYNTTCNTCHISEPVLNELGIRFKANGYQMPGTDDRVPLWSQPPIVLGFLASPAVVHTISKDNSTNESESSTAFGDIGFDMLAGGSLGSHLNYFGAVVVDPTGDGGYEPAVETMQLIYRDVLCGPAGELNFRLGKFLLMSQYPVNLSISQTAYLPYEYDAFGVFDAGGAGSPLAGSLNPFEATFGASLFGRLANIGDGFRYELAFTSGNTAEISFHDSHAFFALIDQTFFIKNAPLHIGGYYYGGSQNLDITLPGATDPVKNSMSRAGITLQLYDPWTRRFVLDGQYMFTSDDMINNGTDFQKVKMTGGFVGLTAILSPEKAYGYTRFDFMKVDVTGGKETQFTLGARYHFMPNVVIFGEVGILNAKVGYSVDTNISATDITETSISFGTAFAF